MKKLILMFIVLLMSTRCFAEDRVKVQVQFRKLIFQCKDGTEEVVDASMTGQNEYEHICEDGKWTNEFLNYSGNVSYTPEEYEVLKAEDLTKEKIDLVNDWIYQKNNPPTYVEPTEEEYKQMIDDKVREIEEYSAKITDTALLESIKTNYESKIIAIDVKVAEEPIIKEVIK